MKITVPDSMRYVEVFAPGGPEGMRISHAQVPATDPGCVLIRVMAAGVNRPDVQQRKGAYPPPPGASPVLGLEVAGEVVELGLAVNLVPGSGVGRIEGAIKEFRIGDRVTALCNGGGYAEYVSVPAAQCLPWPKGFTAVQAAALPENYFTVWANLFELGRLKPGERLLVHGGTSGIGITATQMAVARGSTVFATAGSAAKCEAVRKLRATPINYKEQDFAEVIAEMTEKGGVDVVLDMVGAPYAKRNLKVLAKDGRLVMVAFMEGSKVPDFDLLPVMMKRLTITGSTMRPRDAFEKGMIGQALAREIWPLLDAGTFAPVIDKVFPLAEVQAAHALMESSAHIGKIMLSVAE
jgi:NADPH2:quinone reductase